MDRDHYAHGDKAAIVFVKFPDKPMYVLLPRSLETAIIAATVNVWTYSWDNVVFRL